MLTASILLFWVPYIIFFIICCYFVHNWTKYRKMLIIILVLATSIFSLIMDTLVIGSVSFFIKLFFGGTFAFLILILYLYYLIKK